MKNIFNHSLLTAALLISFNQSFSQAQPDSTGGRPPRPDMQNPNDRQRGQRPEMSGNPMAQLENRRNMFLTKRLDLTPEESAKFFPIYQKQQAEWNELKIKSRLPLLKAQQNEKDSTKTPLKEQEKIKLLENEMTLQEQKLEMIKKYNLEYKKILPPLKLARLYQAEDAFNEEQILKSIRSEERNNKRPERPGSPGHPTPPGTPGKIGK